MAVHSEARVETVTLEMSARERAARVAVFLALGCLLGAGVEVLVRPGSVSAGAESSTSAQATRAREREMATYARTNPAASAKDAGERTPTPSTHHHHVHHTESPTTKLPEFATAVDAGSESDDLAAAIKTLAKAKQEETLP